MGQLNEVYDFDKHSFYPYGENIVAIGSSKNDVNISTDGYPTIFPSPTFPLTELIEKNNFEPITRDDVKKIYNDINKCLMSSHDRTQWTRKIGFPLFTKEDIEELAVILKGKKVLEVLAGTGYLGYYLTRHGVDIIQTDNKSWSDYFFSNKLDTYKRYFFNRSVITMDAIEAIDKYSDWADVVLTTWPPFKESIGEEVVKRCINYGIDILYEGEYDYGNCGSNEMFDLLDNFFNKEVIIKDSLHWYGMNDYYSYYKYRPTLVQKEVLFEG